MVSRSESLAASCAALALGGRTRAVAAEGEADPSFGELGAATA
jgi:hypothetical protein